jgi:hypothetical protein
VQTVAPPPPLSEFVAGATHGAEGAAAALDVDTRHRQLLFLNIPSYGAGADPWFRRGDSTRRNGGLDPQFVGDGRQLRHGSVPGRVGQALQQEGVVLDRAAAAGRLPGPGGRGLQAQAHQLEVIIQQGLEALGAEHREIIVLRDIENLSYQEISEITGLAEGTVKSRLFRARVALKEFVTARYEFDPEELP